MQCCANELSNYHKCFIPLCFLPSYTQTYTIHTTHSADTAGIKSGHIKCYNPFIEHGTQNLISSLQRVTLSLHFSVIEHIIFLAGTTEYSKQELYFLSRKQLVLAITHAVKINTAVSTESTYCPHPSSISLLRSWSEILSCKPAFRSEHMNLFMNKIRGARVQVNLDVFILTSVMPA